jgi:hypothetical protein
MTNEGDLRYYQMRGHISYASVYSSPALAWPFHAISPRRAVPGVTPTALQSHFKVYRISEFTHGLSADHSLMDP